MTDHDISTQVSGDPLRLVGRVLGGGRYRIDSYIGGGGQARVYRGTHMGLRMPVAIKILPPEYAQDPVLLRRFEREARELAQLRHSNIVGIYDYAVEEGLCYTASEFVAGSDLRAMLSSTQGPLPPEKVCAWMQEIGNALQYAHEHHIVHRDVKPGNILVDGATGHAILCDFGLARRTVDDAQVSLTGGNVIGTPAYMSPEQCLLLPIDERTDIYSLALVAYEMLTGKHPIAASGETSEVVRYKQVHLVPSPASSANPKLAADVDKVLLKALAKDPEQRHRTVSDFTADLAAALCPKRTLPSWLMAMAVGVGVVAIALALSWPSLSDWRDTMGNRREVRATEKARTATTEGTSALARQVILTTTADPGPGLVVATPRPTQTPRPAATSTPAPPTATSAPTPTPRPTSTRTALPAATDVPTSTPTPMPSATPVPTSTPILTLTATTSATATRTATATVTRTATTTLASTSVATVTRTATTARTATPPAAATATPVEQMVQVIIVIEGLDDEGIGCSTVMIGRGENQVLQRVALNKAANPRRVVLAAPGATWARFQGSSDGGCPWKRWNWMADYNRVPITGGNMVLTWKFGDISKGGCGAPDEPLCP